MLTIILLAIEKYKQAADIVPIDATPLGNILGAQYELGQYRQCIETAENALAILGDTEDPTLVAVERLKQRIMKAKAQHVFFGEDEQAERRLRILGTVPRCRPLI